MSDSKRENSFIGSFISTYLKRAVNDDIVHHTNDFHSFRHNAEHSDSVENDYHFHWCTGYNLTCVGHDGSLDSEAAEHFVDSNDDSAMVLADRKIHSVNVVIPTYNVLWLKSGKRNSVTVSLTPFSQLPECIWPLCIGGGR